MYYGARSAWERIEPWVTGSATPSTSPEPTIIYGVDVTGSRFFSNNTTAKAPSPMVQKAIDFAAAAHRGQVRKTQEPYVAHCVATAAIVESLLSPTEDGQRAEAAVVTALLHDVLDDAGVDIDDIDREFGPQIASMVSKVSQLSATNQLIRRRLRLNAAQPTHEEQAQLRHMILTMVSEPLVIVVKLADRLHNMRTVYALPPEKQRAVAEETRRVWCSLAERLGMFALKSELEDLCFAVLQPREYRALRAELDEMWGLPRWVVVSSSRDEGGGATSASHASSASEEEDDDDLKIDIKSGGEQGWLGAAHATIPSAASTSPAHSHTTGTRAEHNPPTSDKESEFLTPQQLEVRELIRSVLPFDISTLNMERLRETIPPTARRGLEVLQGCARALFQEITMEGVASGLEVTVQGRVKSLFSTFKKMARKGVPLRQVYDARALRVMVDDGVNGSREREAIAACYRLLPVVHRLWKKVEGEDDDYIAQPKESGYQSLHTAVLGPGGVPMEVQIRTASMHEMAEYGKAAHWAYKEQPPSFSASSSSSSMDSSVDMDTDSDNDGDGDGIDANIEQQHHATVLLQHVEPPPPPPPTPPPPPPPPPLQLAVTAGHPILRIQSGGQLLDAVVVEAEAQGMRLLVATSLMPRQYPSSQSIKADQREYVSILNYVTEKGYFSAGQGDMAVTLEMFTLCSDGKFHKIDQFGHKLATVAVPLTGIVEQHSEKGHGGVVPSSSSTGEDEQLFMSDRIRLLRSMLEWGADIGSGSSNTPLQSGTISGVGGGERGGHEEEHNRTVLGLLDEEDTNDDGTHHGRGGGRNTVVEESHSSSSTQQQQDVMVLIWPSGKIMRVARGTTAGALARREGGGVRRRSNVVNVNNRLVPEGTELGDGDYVILTDVAVKV